MKSLTLASLMIGLVLASAGCAAQAPSSHGIAAVAGPPSRVLALPGTPGEGEPRELRKLVDEPVLQLASIVLRAGTVLPTHHSEVPVTIVALEGSGTVVVGAERLRLDRTHAVFLAPKVPHAVEPDTGTDLVLLVHHFGRGKEHH